MIQTPVLTPIKDDEVKKVLKDLFFNLNNETVIKTEFQFMTFTLNKAETLLKIPHGLGYRPLDIIVTGSYGLGVVTFSYDLFDETNIVVTSTGAATVRLLLGRYT